MSHSFYIQPYLDTLSELDDNTGFVRCESFDGTHICYKLKDDLYDPERHVRYEFLFEFDKDNYAYGIYYGCKCTFLNGDDEELQRKVDQEWSQLREKLTTILNNTCPGTGKDFLKRAKMMERPIDHHYWPFWIRLVEDESILEIATKILRDGIHSIYEIHLSAKAAQSEKNSSVPTSNAAPSVSNTLINSDPSFIFISYSHNTDETIPEGNSLIEKKKEDQKTGDDLQFDTKKPGVKSDTSIVKDFIFDPNNPGERKYLNYDKVIMECQKLIADTTDSGRLRCLFQLLCETEDSTCKILRGKDQFTKFCREFIGIKDEKEVNKTAGRIRKNKTWTKHKKEYKPEIEKMVSRGLIFLP